MADTNRVLLASGFTELALGAVTGWPYALAISDAERAKAIGIRSTPRMRQWHLDLIALGGLTALAATALPDLPRRVGYPLALAAWTSANSFGVLTVRPDLEDHTAYRTALVASFALATWGFVGLGAVAVRRARRGSAVNGPSCAARARGRR